MLRVVYYTLSSFLDLALPFIAETSRLVELHVLLQIHPGAWKSNMFDLAPMALPTGVLPAQPVLERLPAGVQACFAPAASVQLAVFAGQTSVSPANWAAAYRAARAISTIRPDVLHLEGTTGRIVSGFPVLRRLPLVLTIHDPLPHSS
ncbi:MAG: hypothetical protein LUO93_03045, partial [Methanomicrobiales archaeon]|nr:hypothetical protein [Methanomicrobiales archaeon]